MHLTAELLIPALWLLYMAYWALLARTAKGSTQTEKSAERGLRLTVMLAAGWLLLCNWPHWGNFTRDLLPEARWRVPLSLVLTLLGLGFSAYARHHLGRNWSQAVTLKSDHELITSGPYRWVRHPIYTGLLTALLAVVELEGSPRSLLALALICSILLRKLRLEEQWLAAHFGDRYKHYCAHSKALIPFVF